ncbi:MAG: LETM1 domain-containing protein [Bacteroidota bacterium]
MNPSDKGWLARFLLFHEKHLAETPALAHLEITRESQSLQKFLYQKLQPSGLMYGYPIRFLDHEFPYPRTEEWSEKDKLKVLFAEALLFTGLFVRYEPDKPIEDSVKKVVTDVRNFYKQNFERYARPIRSFLGKSRLMVDQIEYIIDHRISVGYDWRNFWSSFFHNSLLFFDLIYFVEWIERGHRKSKESLKQKRQDMRLKMLKIMAAAAHADEKIEQGERDLFNYFLLSANLPAPKKRQATSLFEKGIGLAELDFTVVDTWIMRKYFLELAILTIHSSRKVSEEEKHFLQKMAGQMDLEAEEFLHSMLAVETFVQNYWEDVHYLQIKQNYRIVSERMLSGMRRAIRKNQRRIAQEIRESRELMGLLQKSRKTPLTKAEKEKVRNQLLDILRAIPALTIFMLPFGSLTLPILLRIIPKSVLYPSSFRENEE